MGEWIWHHPDMELHTLGRCYPGCVWDGWLQRVFSLPLGPNSPNPAANRKQAGMGALLRLSQQLLLTGRHSRRVHPHPSYP